MTTDDPFENESARQQAETRLDRTDWTLQLLEQGRHKHVLKMLNNITTDFRVVTDPSVLDQAQRNSAPDDKALLDASEPIGVIRAKFEDGTPRLLVVAVASESDPQHAKLLSESQRKTYLAIFEAIGLTKAPKQLPADKQPP